MSVSIGNKRLALVVANRQLALLLHASGRRTGVGRAVGRSSNGTKVGYSARLRSEILEPPLSTSEIALMIGMSTTFVREEIHSGELRAVLVGRGRKRVYRIPVAEARHYLRKLGLLKGNGVEALVREPIVRLPDSQAE